MNESNLTVYLQNLENGTPYSFNNRSIIPKICAGVYTIWNDKTLIYVGMSGRALNSESISKYRNANSRAMGLITRIKAHASGRRSGDQFCVYVGDRLVLPLLESGQIKQIAEGSLSFDKLIKDYIHENLFFRFLETENDMIAYQLENMIKGGILKAGKPLLNPTFSNL